MSKKRLLIIEDDYDVAEMLVLYFSSHEYEVFHADGGQAGINTARTQFPNLILLDVMLPDMDGYDVCRQLRQMSFTKYIPTIFLTQRDERISKVKGLELGADDYVTKPFDVDELRLRVQGAIRRATRESLHEPRTGLPTGPLVDEELAKRQNSRQAFTEMRLHLEGLQPYTDVYGFMASTEALGFAARAIQGVVGEKGTANDFVGIAEDQFIVLTHAADANALEATIKDKFNEGIKAFYSFVDIERGGLLLNPGSDAERLVPVMHFNTLKNAMSA